MEQSSVQGRCNCCKQKKFVFLVTFFCLLFLCLDCLIFNGERIGFSFLISYNGFAIFTHGTQVGTRSSDAQPITLNFSRRRSSARCDVASAGAENTTESTKEKETRVGPDETRTTSESHSQMGNSKSKGDMTSRSSQFSRVPHRVGSDDSCLGRYIYVHDLPRKFNEDILENCTFLVKWLNMCPAVINSGLGPKIIDSRGVLSNANWFSTNQFLLDVIFHNKMRQYECLTNDSSLASAIYVPFYAGLDVGRYLWDFSTSVRDSLAQDLVKWVSEKPEWKKMWGRDHFLVGGRIAWDYRRLIGNDSGWGNKLMFLPESKNMTMLSIESSTWSNDFAIPYPTYFHPSSETEVLEWQNKMRRQKRRYLFSFAGAPRPSLKDSIRTELINQCEASNGTCKLLKCIHAKNNCDDMVQVMGVFTSSVFCLQPPGDSYTRRSTFDSMLAGCIPVFFHPGSAYSQYTWHLPRNFTNYSVFIPEDEVKHGNTSIEQVLSRIPGDVVLSMREEVIQLIPRIVYADPRTPAKNFKDAFDFAVQGILGRIERVRKKIAEEKDPGEGFSNLNGSRFTLPAISEEQRQDSLYAFREI